MNRLMTSTFALILSAGAALAAPTMTANGAGGDMLTNADGMTLYIFDKDADGVSNCAAECVANWPILAATADDKADGDYTIIDRADGMKQWAYKGVRRRMIWNSRADFVADGLGSSGSGYAA